MSSEVSKIVTELEESRRKCKNLQKQIDELLQDRTSTEKKALEMMRNLAEMQKLHYEAELNSLKGQLMEQTKYIESLERGKTSVVVRAKSLEEEVIQRRKELEEAATQIKQLQDNLSKVDERAEITLDRTTRALLEEISKIKGQKAELRCRFMSLEREHGRLTNERDALKEALEDLDSQCDQLMTAQNKTKQKTVELSTKTEESCEAKRHLEVELEKIKSEMQVYKNEVVQERKDKQRLEQQITFLREELEATHKDYREELGNFSRLVAAEKGISTEYMGQMESLKTSKRDTETQLHMVENLFQEATRERRLLEEKLLETDKKYCDLMEKCNEKSSRAKDALDQAITKLESYKKDSEQFKAERDAMENLYKTTKQSLDLEIMKMNATILQHQKLITHLQTQLNTPKRRCILERKTPNPNALTSEKLEELLDDYRRQNMDLSSKVRTLQTALNEERAKHVAKPPKREIVGREIAIIKKSSSFSSDISSGTSSGDGVMRHNIPHRWIKHVVTKRTKCMACMDDLQIYRPCAKCEACRTTVHHKCAENLMNTCGLPMLYSDHFYEEEKRMKDNLAEARMYGWVKLWRSTVDAWNDVWGSLENAMLSFYQSADTKQMPIEKIDLRTCTWKIHLRTGVEKSDACAVTNSDLPYIIEIKINPTVPNDDVVRMYMLTPDLPSKQRWLSAFKKAIPESNLTD